MLKLMKYEFRKQLFSKIVILVAVGVLELIFLYGIFFKNERAAGVGIGLFVFLAFASIMFVSFECIFTFSNDLKTKQSYMLFLTPNSAYSIVGAKVATSFITIALTALALCVVVVLNIGIVLIKYEEIAKIKEMLEEFYIQIFKSDIDYWVVAVGLVYFVCSWIATVIIGMASITLSSTFLSNSKAKGVVSVIFFFGINWLISLVQKVIPKDAMSLKGYYLAGSLFMAAVVVIFYFGTSWMLDKKVSV